MELWHTQEPEFSHFSTTQNAIDARLIASWAPKPTRLYLGNPLLAPRCRCCGICPSPATSRALGRGSPGTDPAGRSRAHGPVPAPEQRRSRQVSALITRLNAPFKKKKKLFSNFTQPSSFPAQPAAGRQPRGRAAGGAAYVEHRPQNPGEPLARGGRTHPAPPAEFPSRSLHFFF